MELQKLVSIPVVTVLFSLCFIYYVTVFVFIQDWLDLQSSAGSLNALILSFFVLMCIFSFFICVLTDPGGIPSSYTPDVERNGSSDQEFQKNVCFFTFSWWISIFSIWVRFCLVNDWIFSLIWLAICRICVVLFHLLYSWYLSMLLFCG